MAEHIIKEVIEDSIAAQLGIVPGDVLLKINDVAPADIFDYQLMTLNEYIEVWIRKINGEEFIYEIDKDEAEDIGLEFELGLMDHLRSCENKCIFCFMDQLPKGMRETLYYKDDDFRLSFLLGNYITLTNLSEADINRIIRYNLTPINISIHTACPKLRVKMLNNLRAGKLMDIMRRFQEAGIMMNGQIVLCRGVNDGKELANTLRELMLYQPELFSVAIVPAGLSKYREGLYPLEQFSKEEAEAVLDMIKGYNKLTWSIRGKRLFFASDEWYTLAERKLPLANQYEEYPQLENGVGMMRLFITEFNEALNKEKKRRKTKKYLNEIAVCPPKHRQISVATGLLAYPYLKQLVLNLTGNFPELTVNLYGITNHFFGENITVSGLLTGADIINQLKDKPLGERLLLPDNVLRSSGDIFLDDFTQAQIKKALQVPVDIVESSGYAFVEALLCDNTIEGKVTNE
ncbi:MAG: DUF512 domain-containing protein [Lachnospiraceae bacterium]|nr:DUF512 domain-containing protein [Lachnospiraceae bacterium]